ncbi:MAG: hypothetical protein ACRDSH_20405, partial [Pseudonocardiaceae bacterium]
LRQHSQSISWWRFMPGTHRPSAALGAFGRLDFDARGERFEARQKVRRRYHQSGRQIHPPVAETNGPSFTSASMYSPLAARAHSAAARRRARDSAN